MVSEIRELIKLREKHCLVRTDATTAIGIREQTFYILENNNNQPTQPLPHIFPELEEFLIMLYGFPRQASL